jgi:hypothetical protein
MKKWFVVLAAMAILLVPRPSYAYLDPNAGSILAQLFIGGVGLLTLLRLFWSRIKARFQTRGDK